MNPLRRRRHRVTVEPEATAPLDVSGELDRARAAGRPLTDEQVNRLITRAAIDRMYKRLA